MENEWEGERKIEGMREVKGMIILYDRRWNVGKGEGRLEGRMEESVVK